jgi:hypothetical protein
VLIRGNGGLGFKKRKFQAFNTLCAHGIVFVQGLNEESPEMFENAPTVNLKESTSHHVMLP